MTSITDTAIQNPAHRIPSDREAHAAVRIWLVVIAAFVFAMVVVGGATRLTGSGLSITEWQPILGAIPPLSEAAWLDAFEKYRHIPQYELINKGMSLAEFKGIYWWEWGHRLLGRSIGFVFAIPFAYFLWRRQIPKPFIPRVALLFVLGLGQGALGWFMVKSGLADRVSVSQYRLAAHLALAVVIAGYAFWLALALGAEAGRRQSGLGAKQRQARSAPGFFYASGAFALLVYLQIVIGGFVAGLKAGHAANTWPLMGDSFVPAGLDNLSPWYSNLFENPLTAQFVHRMAAYALTLFALLLAAAIFLRGAERLRLSIAAVCAAVLFQTALGIATIVYDVPINLALAHQANAIALFAFALWHLRRSMAPMGLALK